jgi:hypothetical protein
MRYIKHFLFMLLAFSSTCGHAQSPRIPDPIHESWNPRRHHPAVIPYSESLLSNDDMYHAYDATQYLLNIDFNPVEGTIAGHNTIFFKVTGEVLGTLIVDAVDMKIDDVLWSDGSPLLFTYDQKQLRITLPFEFAKGYQGSLKIFFTSLRPQSLSLAGPDVTRPDRVNAAYTYTQPDGTRRWFPCHDIPSDKTLTAMTFIAPRDFRVVSNGEEFKKRILPNQKVAYSFTSQASIASYLTSVVIAPMESELLGYWRQSPLLLSGPKYLMPALRKESSRTVQMLQAFEDFTQTPYPFEKYRQTVAEGYNASMEHQSATTMGGRRIVGDMSGESVIAHELAHQWFGDLVTCAVWGDMWLNEGFASYLPYVFFDSVGDDESALTSILGSREWYFEATNVDTARPMATSEEWPEYDIFDQHSYAKGAMVIHLVRSIANKAVGPQHGVEAFSSVLQHYFKRHSFGNVRTVDLRASLEAVTGFSWLKFFEHWVFQEGHPQVSSSWTWEKGVLNIEVRQEQALRPVKPWKVFSFPLRIAIVAEDGTSRIQEVFIEDKEHTFMIDTEKKVEAIVLDPTMLVPATFATTQSVEAWASAFLASTDSFSQAHIIASVFQAFDDAQRAIFCDLMMENNPDETTLALLARNISHYSGMGLIESARAISSHHLRSFVAPSLRGNMAELDLWISKHAGNDASYDFDSFSTLWLAASRVEEREFYLEAMGLKDLERAQKFALGQLALPKWTDRDRIALSLILAKKITDHSKPFALSLLESGNTVNILRPFTDVLIETGFSDPEVLPIATKRALSDRATAMRSKYIKLIALQSLQKDGACESLKVIEKSVHRDGTVDDKEFLFREIDEATKKLACSF